MSSDFERYALCVTMRLEGPRRETQALLTQIFQANTLQIDLLPLPTSIPSVAKEIWQSRSADAPGETLQGLRFRAGSVCAYLSHQTDQPVQVEFQVFTEEPCSLECVLDELPALLAILHDPEFQNSVGWRSQQSEEESC